MILGFAELLIFEQVLRYQIQLTVPAKQARRDTEIKRSEPEGAMFIPRPNAS